MVKVKRSFPAPASLALEKCKANGKYNGKDVVRQLAADFHGKCYICEIGDLQDPVVEHLVPHAGDKDRKFDWENLFFCCHHCNAMKNETRYDNGILDCCRVDPERYISFELRSGQVEIKQLALIASGGGAVSQNLVKLTVDLLNDVYNRTDTGIRIESCAVRFKALQEEMDVFLRTLEGYERACRRGQERPMKRNLDALKGFLDRSAPFAAFKRNYVRGRSARYASLMPLLA